MIDAFTEQWVLEISSGSSLPELNRSLARLVQKHFDFDVAPVIVDTNFKEGRDHSHTDFTFRPENSQFVISYQHPESGRIRHWSIDMRLYGDTDEPIRGFAKLVRESVLRLGAPEEILEHLREDDRVGQEDNSTGPYSIGSRVWPGLAKVIEEGGETLQVASKIIGNNGGTEYFDGTNLADRLVEEVGDLLAAIDYMVGEMPLDMKLAIGERMALKAQLFKEWHHKQNEHAPEVEGYRTTMRAPAEFADIETRF